MQDEPIREFKLPKQQPELAYRLVSLVVTFFSPVSNYCREARARVD